MDTGHIWDIIILKLGWIPGQNEILSSLKLCSSSITYIYDSKEEGRGKGKFQNSGRAGGAGGEQGGKGVRGREKSY